MALNLTGSAFQCSSGKSADTGRSSFDIFEYIENFWTYVEAAGQADPGAVVIDEVAGQWLALIAIPLDPLLYLLAFLAFRLFDILKPWPVGWADREVKGGLGIMLDDALAADYAAAVLWGVAWAMGG